MKNSLVLALTLALAATGCFSEVTTSSTGYLGHQGSVATVKGTASDSALEITRLFAARGFTLIDQHANGTNGQIALEYKGNRSAAGARARYNNDLTYSIASVFYVWVTPAAPDSAAVTMLGKPTLNNQEPCTDGPALPCETVYAPAALAPLMSGADEAEIVHGVFAELTLEGQIIGAPPPSPAEVRSASIASCEADRRKVVAESAKIDDHADRIKLLQSLPATCE